MLSLLIGERHKNHVFRVIFVCKAHINDAGLQEFLLFEHSLHTSDLIGDAIAFAIEAKSGIDIRKAMFYALAEKNYPLMGLEAIGMSLEDIFIKLVDKEGA